MDNTFATKWARSYMDRAHTTVDTLRRTDGADIDYSLAYSNVQTFGSEKVELKPAKVMTIYRMYLLLSSLNSNMFKAEFLSGVEELVVVADVVVINGFEAVRLPGTRRVVILCRVLEFKDDGSSAPSSVGSSSILTSLRAVVADSAVEIKKRRDGSGDFLEFTALQFGGGKPTQLFVFAQGEIPPDGRSKENDWVCFEQGPLWRERLSASKESWLEHQMQVFPYRGEGQNDFAEKVKFYTENSSRTTSILNYPVKQVPGPSVGFVVSAKFKVPVHLLEDPHVVMGLQVLLLVAEGILLHRKDAAGKDAVNAAVLHCKWLTTFVLPNRAEVKKDGVCDEALLEELDLLYFRAQGLATLYAGGTPKELVPPLNYKLYRDSIQQVAVTARLYDEELKATLRLQTIEKNFMKQNRVLAAKEKDVEESKGRVLERKKVELKDAQTELNKLLIRMEAEEKAMRKARNSLEEEIEKYVTEGGKAADKAEKNVHIQIFSDFVVAHSNMFKATQGDFSSETFDSFKLAQDPQFAAERGLEIAKKFINVRKALNELTDLLQNGIRGINVSMTRMPNPPTTSEWKSFENEVMLVVEKLPDKISGSKDWKAKCKNVVAVGRDISRATSHVTTLQYKLKLAGWGKDIASKHRERLQHMDPADSASHPEMAMHLELKSLRMTNSLLEILNIQNGALHYHYLQRPEAVVPMGPTIYNVQEMLIQNDRNAVAFNEILGKSSELQREYVLKNIPVRLLLDGDDFHHTISINDDNFPASWQRVRIQYLTMKFTGPYLPRTDTGEIYLVLSGDHVFFDRYNEDIIGFEAAKALQYPFAYNLSTGNFTLENREIPSELGIFMRMTPFSRWKLRVPKSAYENTNLRFENTAPDAADAAKTAAADAVTAKSAAAFDAYDVRSPMGAVFETAVVDKAAAADAAKHFAPEDAMTEITITFHLTLIRKIE